MKDRKILITGATGDIGKQITKKVLSKGCSVVGLIRNKKKSINFSEKYFPYEIDFSNSENISTNLDKIIVEHPEIDSLICCAGFGEFKNIENFSEKNIREFINVNLVSQIIVSSKIIPILKTKKFGDIIFIGSEAALKGTKKGSLYCAAKFGLRGFSQSIREECASRNVKVCIINPGMIRTNFFKNLNFRPGNDLRNAINLDDITKIVITILTSDIGTVIDEVNISPQKKVIQFL